MLAFISPSLCLFVLPALSLCDRHSSLIPFLYNLLSSIIWLKCLCFSPIWNQMPWWQAATCLVCTLLSHTECLPVSLCMSILMNDNEIYFLSWKGVQVGLSANSKVVVSMKSWVTNIWNDISTLAIISYLVMPGRNNEIDSTKLDISQHSGNWF